MGSAATRPSTPLDPTPTSAAFPRDQIRASDRLGADVVVDLTAPGGAERYSAWADRMTAKRDRDRAIIAGEADPPAVDHWSTASTLGMGGEDRALTDPAGPDPWELAQARHALGLDGDAGPAELAAAFRTLAKRHHPDRWAQADAEERREHAETMLRVNAAYRILRGPASVG